MAELLSRSENFEQDHTYPHPTDPADLASVRPRDTLSYHQDEEHSEALYSRRSFLGIVRKTAVYSTLALGGAMETVRLDTMTGEIVNPPVKMALEHVAPAQSPAVADKATLFIPGFNVLSGVPAAEAIAKEAACNGEVLGLTHASDRFSIDTLEAQTREYIKSHGITSLTLVGSSLGGLISTELASRIKEVDLVVADSSPADPSDAKELPQDFIKQVLENVSWALDTLGLSGGPGMRTTTEFIKRLHDGDKDVLVCLKEALAQDYSKSCPNPLVLDLYLFMMTHNVQSKKDTLGETAFAYLGADDPDRDTVVDQKSSQKKYSDMCRERDAPYIYLTSRDTAHADIAIKGAPYGEMYRRSIESIRVQRQEKLQRSLGLNTFRILGR